LLRGVLLRDGDGRAIGFFRQDGITRIALQEDVAAQAM
jgi:hypothetical protein